jgi:hypothetical protein
MIAIGRLRPASPASLRFANGSPHALLTRWLHWRLR